MRRRRDRRHKAGMTLVEVMLAGALTALVALATLEGFIVAAKISHENAEALQADSEAFDKLWCNFYHDYDRLIPAVLTNAYEQVAYTNSGKMLYIDLPYGANNRYTRHLEVFRSDIPRVSN